MKKTTKITLGAIAAVSALYVGGMAPVAMPSGIVGSAYAATKKPAIKSSGILSLVSYEGAFNNNFKSTITRNESEHYFIVNVDVTMSNPDAMLSQATESGAAADTYYLGLSINDEDDGWKKAHTIEKNTTVVKDADATALGGSWSNTGNASDDTTMWAPVATIKVTDGNGGWNTLANTTVNGVMTLGDRISANLSKDVEDLVYGEDWIAVYNNSNDFAARWTDTSGDNKHAETVIVRFSSALPTGTGNVLYRSLDEALEAGETAITLNADTNLASNLTLESGVTIKVANDDIKLTRDAGVKIVYKGGAIENAAGNKSLITTVKETSTNPVTGKKTSTESDYVLAGEEIEINTPAAIEGYTIKTVIKDKGANKVIEAEDGKYIVPATTDIITIDHTYIDIAEALVPAVDEEDDDKELIATYPESEFGVEDSEELMKEIADSDDIKDLLMTNAKVDITLEVETKEEADLDDLSKAVWDKINDLAEENNIKAIVGIYEATLTAKGQDDGREKTLSDLGDNAVTLAIKLPEGEGRDYYVIRIHDVLDEDGNVIDTEVEIIKDLTIKDGYATFENSKFSTFLLTYAESGVVAPDPIDPDVPNPDAPAPSNPTDTPVIVNPDDKTPAEVGDPDTGVFTGDEKSAAGSSILAAIASTITAAGAACAKFFKKNEQ